MNFSLKNGVHVYQELGMKNDLYIDAKFAFSFKLYSDISLLMPCIFCVPTSKLSKDGCRQREKVYRLDGCPPAEKSLQIGWVSASRKKFTNWMGARRQETVYILDQCLRNGGFQAVEVFWRLG